MTANGMDRLLPQAGQSSRTCGSSEKRARTSLIFKPTIASTACLSADGDDHRIRAFLIEQGIAMRSGVRALRNSLFSILKERGDEISSRMADLIVGLYEDWLWLDERIESVTLEIEQIAQTETSCQRLMSVPPVISTAMVAAIGDSEAFERSRDGDKYLRTLFIQAAKVLPMHPHNWD